MAEQFDTVDVDMTDEEQHRIIDMYVKMHLSPPSIETYEVSRLTDSVERSLYLAIINEMVLNAIDYVIKRDSESTPPKL